MVTKYLKVKLGRKMPTESMKIWLNEKLPVDFSVIKDVDSTGNLNFQISGTTEQEVKIKYVALKRILKNMYNKNSCDRSCDV